MALPKKNRLATKKDIDKVFRRGRTVKGSFLFVKSVVNDKHNPRFAFLVPAKLLNLAVKRNRLRRILAEEVAKSLVFKKNLNIDVIVVVYKKIDEKTFLFAADDLAGLLETLK